MEDQVAPIWEMILTWIMFFGLIGGAIAASLWARRRRRSGREASTTEGEGSEAIIFDFRHGPLN